MTPFSVNTTTLQAPFARAKRGERAVVAMSGGVDSSVAAAVMVAAGYDVTGVMLKLWRGDAANHDSGCCNVGAAEDARRVADALGIPFYVLNMADLFESTVVTDFHAAYAAGRTPNPCVRCNQWIKFDALLQRADALGARVLATGHYARVVRTGPRLRLLRGADRAKDQSYVLWMLTQDKLARARFPVGHLSKTQTRRLAADLGLRTAAKPESQEICFVPGGDVHSYVDARVAGAATPGPVVDVDGRVVGTHRGVGHYTVGQRRGLGVSLGEPVFVTGIDAAANTVTVGPRNGLAVAGLDAHEASYTAAPPERGAPVLVQHRAHGPAGRAHVVRADLRSFTIAYERPVEAVAPGQSAVLYSAADSDEVIGGGVIAATTPGDG